MSNPSDATAGEHAGLVLLAEDSTTVARLLTVLLDGMGFTVRRHTCAELIGGELAGLVQAGSAPALVVIDTSAAGAEEAVAFCADRALPLLALDVDGNDVAGAIAVLGLPVEADALAGAVRRCITVAADGLDAKSIEAVWGSAKDPGFQSVARVFCGELDERIALLGDALAAEELPEAEREAHALKGAASSVGAFAVAAAAARLEAAARQGRAGVMPALLTKLTAAAATGARALRAITGMKPGTR